MASALDAITGAAKKVKTTWDAVNDTVDNARNEATYAIMDAIIRNKMWKTAYETVMLGANAAQVIRNQCLQQRQGFNSASGLGLEVASFLSGVTGLLDISLVTTAAAAYTLGKASPFLQDVYEKTREVDVGDQPMIVQSTSQKQYWTDNAVPKLKEWNIEGYITPTLSLDSLYLIKPSLKMQMNYLDTCAASRRPVLFKDNRGEFIFVNIMSLQTTEEASYNNAIKVNISLKEYRPFTVKNIVAQIKEATTTPIS